MWLSDFKKLYKLGRLVLHRGYLENQRKTHPLSFIFWEATARCNLRCKHCGLSCGTGSGSDEVAAEFIKKAFDDIAEQMNPAKIMIGVTGGEPLLRGDLFEIMAYAANLGFPWGMVTNGFYVNEEAVRKMKSTGMKTVAVSLDGMESTHNWIRNNAGAFSRAINAIQLLRRAGSFEVVEAITSVCPRSLRELEALYELCISLDVDQWRIMPIVAMGRAENDSQVCLSAIEMAQTLQFIRKKRAEGKLKVTLNEMWFCGPEFEFDVRDRGFFCSAGIHALAILQNGDVNGCPLVEGMVEGNIKNDNVAEIWKSGFKNYRDVSWRKTGKCKECEWFDICSGDGLHLWRGNKKQLTKCSYALISKGCKEFFEK